MIYFTQVKLFGNRMLHTAENVATAESILSDHKIRLGELSIRTNTLYTLVFIRESTSPTLEPMRQDILSSCKKGLYDLQSSIQTQCFETQEQIKQATFLELKYHSLLGTLESFARPIEFLTN